jgi:hypothetical protein
MKLLMVCKCARNLRIAVIWHPVQSLQYCIGKSLHRFQQKLPTAVINIGEPKFKFPKMTVRVLVKH